MKQHHARTHDESLAGEEATCEYCGGTYRAKPSHMDRRKYCSKKCEAQSHSERTGEDHPLWNRVEMDCTMCGSSFQVKPSHADSRVYCSESCYTKAKEELSGEDHPLWNRTELECGVCGDVFFVKKSHAEKREHCSIECYAESQEGVAGEDHPCWKGGGVRYYGPNWEEQRNKTRERDDHECQVCGSPEIHVHHIRPIRTFDTDEYEQANALQNLICLCPSHHKKWEGIPLRPQTD